MKRIFRRNQIIITTLAVMIAAAGYLNYSSKKEVAGAEVYEAGMMDRVRNLLVQKFPGRRQRLRELRIRVRRCSPAEQGSPST